MSEPTPGSEPHAQGDPDLSDDAHPAEPASGEEPIRRRADRHKDRKHPWLRRGGIALAAGLAVILVLSVAAYVKLTGNIERLDLGDALGIRPSPQATTDKNTKLTPLNILVMGSDLSLIHI